MKCVICGRESGKYQYCRQCYAMHTSGVQGTTAPSENTGDGFIYEPKTTLMSKSEQSFYQAILGAVPANFHVFPQINLASFIEKTDGSRYRNELFRNLDFLITDESFRPRIAIEINDQTHMTQDRKERDEKVHNILEEAGIPLMKLWTSYGVNQEYIKGKVQEILSAPPAQRIHHFTKGETEQIKPAAMAAQGSAKKQGCYVATCVYGSYDCPEVWVLRRFRDYRLAKSVLGRAFVKAYYAVSPTAVSLFGKTKWFTKLFRNPLDRFVAKLRAEGVEDTPYYDK